MTTTTGFALEATDPDCIDPNVAVDIMRGLPWRRLAVLGDSVAAGIREPVDGYVDEAFANRVGEALVAAHDGAAYVNLGVRDLKIAAIHATQLRPALEFRPDLAMVIAGGNDALSRRWDPDVATTLLRDLLAALHDAGAFIVTVGLFDLARSGLVSDEYAPALMRRFDELDAITAPLAAEFGGVHVDSHHHRRAADPGIFASDLMHANARGHAIAFAATVRALAATAFGSSA